MFTKGSKQACVPWVPTWILRLAILAHDYGTCADLDAHAPRKSLQQLRLCVVHQADATSEQLLLRSPGNTALHQQHVRPAAEKRAHAAASKSRTSCT